MGSIGNLSKLIKPATYKNFYNAIKTDALFKRLLRNSSYLLSANVIVNGLGFVQSILMARFLGVEKYGLLALITTYVMAVNQLLDFRVWETVIKYVSEFWVKGDKTRAWATVKFAYWIDFLTGVLAFLIAVLAAPLAASLLHRSEIAGLASIFALKLLFSTINGTSGAILRVFDKFKWISIQVVIQAAITLGLVASVLFAGYGIKEVLVAYIISAFVGTLIFSYFSLKIIHSNMWDVRKKGRISLLRGRFREIGWFLFHTNVGAFWGMFIRQFDVLILGHFRSATEVGYFKMAKHFVLLIGKIYDPLYSSLFPEISKLWALGDVKKFNRFLKKLTFITISIFVPFGLVMFLFCAIVIDLTVGPEFGSSVLSIRIMTWGITIACVFVWARPTVIAIGKPIIGNIAGMINAFLFLLVSLLLVSKYGYVASSAIFLLPFISGSIIHICSYLYLLRKNLYMV